MLFSVSNPLKLFINFFKSSKGAAILQRSLSGKPRLVVVRVSTSDCSGNLVIQPNKFGQLWVGVSVLLLSFKPSLLSPSTCQSSADSTPCQAKDIWDLFFPRIAHALFYKAPWPVEPPAQHPTRCVPLPSLAPRHTVAHGQRLRCPRTRCLLLILHGNERGTVPVNPDTFQLSEAHCVSETQCSRKNTSHLTYRKKIRHNVQATK